MERGLGWFGALMADFHWVALLLIVAALGLGVGLGIVAVERGYFGYGKMTEARRQWSRRLADASFDGLLVHRNGTVLQMNGALVRMLGYREMELLGTHFSNLGQPAQMAELRTELEAPQPQVSKFILLSADKSERFVELASHTLEFDGLPATVTAIRDLTAVRGMEARLAHLMHNDGLTGLANAAMFAERLEDAVAQNDTAGGTTAVLTLELEQLKAVNEQLGRSGGDNLLRQIANRLRGMADDSDTIARLGGNQFAIVQPHAGAANRTLNLTSQIEAAMEEPFIVEGKAVRAGMAIGVAMYPEHATGPEGLINASGFALSKAIQAGGTHMFSHTEAAAAGFTSAAGGKGGAGGLRMLSLEEQRLAHDLRLGISRGEIRLEYQPVFGSRFLSISGFEAFARWLHPKEGEISPARFIGLADDAGLAGALGDFIIETACAEAMRCKAPTMAINLSPAQFRDPQLPNRMHDILHRTGLPPGKLEVQVTEAMLLEQPAASIAALRAIRGLGVGLTLDDFGTGFSSLTNLSDFPFNRIKIDKRYIHQLTEDSNAQKRVSAILSLAHSLDIEVTAEGIESEAQLSFLQEKDCNFVQGFHLGRPGPISAATAPPTPLAAAAAGISGLGKGNGKPVKPSLVVGQR